MSNTEQNLWRPYPTWFIYLVWILFWPLATGIIWYKSVTALGKMNVGKIILRTSIVITLIFWAIWFSWEKYLWTIASVASVGFAGLIGKIQKDYIASWRNESANWIYENKGIGIAWAILWALIYLLPFILYSGYLYIFPCPSWYEVSWNFCFPVYR